MAHALRAWAISEQEKSQSVTYSTDLELDYLEVLRKLCLNTHCIKDKISSLSNTFIMHTFSHPKSVFGTGNMMFMYV